MIGTFLKTAAVTVATGAGVLLGVALGSDAYEAGRERMVGPRKQEKVAVEVKGNNAKARKRNRKPKHNAQLAKKRKTA